MHAVECEKRSQILCLEGSPLLVPEGFGER